MVLDVLHPGRSTIPKTELRDLLAKKFNVHDEKTVYLYGFKTDFGGQRSTGFALIYDSLEDALDSEPKYRLIRAGLKTKREGSRKSRKELKNRQAKVWGKKKASVGAGGKKAA